MAASERPRGWARLSARATTVLLAGLAVREALSFWTGDPYDFESWVRTAYVVAHGTNPYSGFWPPVPGLSFAFLGQPLTPAAYLPFWSALLGEIYRFWAVAGGGNRFVLYFLLKQPGIVADVGSAYLIYRLLDRWTGRPAAALAGLSFWSGFPYAIAITAVWGQFDSIVVLLVLGVLFARTGIERNVMYGLGIFAKYLTVIFLPLDLLRERSWRRLGFLVALVVPGALTLAVFAAEGWSWVGIGASGLSQSHGGGGGMNFDFLLGQPGVSAELSHVPGLYVALGYLWAPGVIAAGVVAARWVRSPSPTAELRAMLLVVAVFLLLRDGLFEQYFLYLFAPFVLDVMAFHPGRRRFLLYTYAVAGLDLLVNNDLGLRFLSPLSTGIEPYTTALDANGTWGVFRFYALIAFSVVMTVTLVQLIHALLHDEERPVPWLLRLPAWVSDRLRRAGTS